MRSMTVGQVARLAAVGVETVRFYEKNGLLEEPARRASGYREYDEETVRRLRFIQRAKELGFTPEVQATTRLAPPKSSFLGGLLR